MTLFDTTTWIAVGAAIGSALIVMTLAVLVLALRSREKRAPAHDVDRMLREADQRFGLMLDDLAAQLHRAREEARQSNRLSGLASTIDLAAVAERVLEAARDLPAVDASALYIPLPEEEPFVVTAGMTREEAESQAIPPEPEAGARAVTIAYRYAGEEAEPPRVRGGLVVPLAGEERPVGTLAVFWREDREASEQELAALEELAASAGPAVENAVRFRGASRLADLDALTGLHNRRFFHETLARECGRAGRYDRHLALLVFDVDDFKRINDRIGHLAGDTVLAELADRVRAVVRGSDVPCRVGGDEFAVILPESSLEDAEQLYRRLGLAIADGPTGPIDRLKISGGVAELRREDEPVTFFERADEALYRAKQAGKGQAMAAND